jgi:tetratricopeptide (TPR) repeat protein
MPDRTKAAARGGDISTGDLAKDAVQREVRARLIGILAFCAVAAAMVIFLVIWLAPPLEPQPVPDSVPATAGGAAPALSVAAPSSAASIPREAAIVLPTTAVPATAEGLQNEAQRVAKDLHERFPDLHEALHVLAMTHAKLRQTAEAEKLWQKCVELAPNNEQYRVNLAAIAMDRGNSELAVQTLEAAESGSASPDVSHHLGVALTNLGRCEEAEGVIQKALAAYPQSPSHWVVLGQAQLKLGKAADAEASLQKAIDLGARTASVYFTLASAYARQGKDDEAAKCRKLYADLSAAQPLAAQERYQILSTAEARRTAVAILNEAATVHSWQGDSLEAERLLLRALALDPASAASCRALAALYREAGMHLEERVVWQRLVEIEPHNFDNYLNLARLCAQLGESQAAEATLKLAIAIWPEVAGGYTALAQFHLQAGRAKQARWFAQEAVRRQPTAEGYVLLASTCRLLGDDASAAAAFAEARKLEPNVARPMSRTAPP